MPSLQMLLASLVVAASDSFDLIINLTHPLSTVSSNFLGVNIDSASLYQGLEPHRLNFSDAGFLAIAQRFANARNDAAKAEELKTVLRIGGSAAEDLGFGVGSGQVIKMEEAYWDSIVSFANAANLSLSFDLNAGPKMRVVNSGRNEWNSSNARALLSYIAERPDHRAALGACQLGNEPGHTLTGCNTSLPGSCISAVEHGRDFAQLRAVLHEVFAGKGVAAPRIQGPDACFGLGNGPNPNLTHGDKCASLEYLEQLLIAAAGAIDEITVHSYGLDNPGQCTDKDFVSPWLWEPKMRKTLRAWRSVQQRVAPDARMVLSETASAAEGGCPSLSNSFAAGFFWVNQLGLVAEEGFWQTYRQDLVGWSGIGTTSSYALAGEPGWVGFPHDDVWSNRTEMLVANPDFFTSLLWKRLMGPQHLAMKLGNITSSTKLPIRAHVACAGVGEHGDLTIAYTNGGLEDISVRLHDLRASSRVEYVLTPGDDHGLNARFVRLNGGERLDVHSDLRGKVVDSDLHQLTFIGQSYGFFALRGTGASACMHHIVV